MRTETDALGKLTLDANTRYGIHTARAVASFGPADHPVPRDLIHAYADVKRACARVNHRLGYLTDEQATALEAACTEMAAGLLDEWIVVDAFQGGAGTSTNMNVNEVLANTALLTTGRECGDYGWLHPIDHVNLHQSTNDTYPTALRVAVIRQLRTLSDSLVRLVESFQQAEKRFADVAKVGRTEMQDAVLITLGREMGAYAEAFSRDRWRVFKCEERIRVSNLGGTAVGTGITAPRQFIFQATEELRTITGLPIARAENLVEATQNQDAWVEVAGILKALASNLIKIGNDLRLLSSGPHAGLREIHLPPMQEGPSLMPGKVNPVIPEMAVQTGMATFGFEHMISLAVSAGNLELNAFMPLIAYAMLTSLDLLERAVDRLARLCVQGIEADREQCANYVITSHAVATALVPVLGHDATARLVAEAERSGRSLRDVAVSSRALTAEEWEDLTSVERVNALGSPVVRKRREEN
ncbi:MAG TPA: aspartate ammonia-lyase [Candidatus Latescibacteria bacterium]|nr:aspartate ammonia-lyase [Candidatus Latescibacterota bacterium]